MGSIQAFAGSADTAQRLGLKDSADRARENVAREYRRVMLLLERHPLPAQLREGFESRLAILRSLLHLPSDAASGNGSHLTGANEPAATPRSFDRSLENAGPADTRRVNGHSAGTPPEDSTFEDPPVDRLTSRETRILKLIAEGNSSRQLALRPGISFRTGTCHRYNIMSKLNLHDTSALVRYAIRSGLVRL